MADTAMPYESEVRNSSGWSFDHCDAHRGNMPGEWEIYVSDNPNCYVFVDSILFDQFFAIVSNGVQIYSIRIGCFNLDHNRVAFVRCPYAVITDSILFAMILFCFYVYADNPNKRLKSASGTCFTAPPVSVETQTYIASYAAEPEIISYPLMFFPRLLSGVMLAEVLSPDVYRIYPEPIAVTALL